jgi:hypothetical protein
MPENNNEVSNDKGFFGRLNTGLIREFKNDLRLDNTNTTKIQYMQPKQTVAWHL